jgi:hypothetical protein
MRNFTTATVAATEAFRGDYRIALAWARSRQKEVKEGDAISYTIEGDENGEGVVTKHVGQFGGQPPYQPIIHKTSPVNAQSEA